MRLWIVALVILGSCSAGWSQEERLEFIGACQESGMGEGHYLFCACWQDEIEKAGISPDEFGEPNDTTIAAMQECM